MGDHRPRSTQETNGREIRGDHAQSHRKPRHASPGKEEITRTLLTGGEKAAEQGYPSQIGDHNEIIKPGESSHLHLGVEMVLVTLSPAGSQALQAAMARMEGAKPPVSPSQGWGPVAEPSRWRGTTGVTDSAGKKTAVAATARGKDWEPRGTLRLVCVSRKRSLRGARPSYAPRSYRRESS